MAKNWGRLVLFAAAAGAAAAGTYYYLQKHKKAADPECEAYDGDAAADDDFEDDDFFDDDFEDEEEDCEKKDTSRIFTAGTNAQGHTYVTLDLKAASDKAANLCDNVATKFGEAVQKLKIPREKVGVTIQKYGNTSSSSVAILLDEMNREGKFKSGDKIVLSGFGGGLTWGATLLEW